MTSVSKYLRIAALILVGLCGTSWIVGTLRTIEPIVICIYTPIIILVTVGMMYLVWKRPLLAGVLLFGLTLLLVLAFAAAVKEFIEGWFVVTIWDYLKFFGIRIGPLLLASLLLLASWLIQRCSLKRAATQ